MNSWAPEQFNMMGMNPGMIQNQMPPPLPLPDSLIHNRGGGGPQWNQNEGPNGGPETNFIGPVPSENQDASMDLTLDDESSEKGDDGGLGSKNHSGHKNEGSRGRQSGNHMRESRWNRNRDTKGIVLLSWFALVLLGVIEVAGT